jgi:hypothetical protein
MYGWMYDQMRSGRMMGSMMWGNPDQMRTACQQWMGSYLPSGSTVDPEAWCNQLVDWMTSHMGAWSTGDGWGGLDDERPDDGPPTRCPPSVKRA